MLITVLFHWLLYPLTDSSSYNMLLIVFFPPLYVSFSRHPSLVWEQYNTKSLMPQAIVIMPATISYQE